MANYINLNIKPTDDFIFKIIFGSKGNEDILISFLNSLFKEYDYLPTIKSITINNSSSIKKFDIMKQSILDIKATTDTDRLINIEIQTEDNGNIVDRGLTYCSQMISEGTEEGGNYIDPEVISIWILNGKLRQDNVHYRRKSYIEISQLYTSSNKLDKECIKATNKLTLIHIYLCKFKEGIYNQSIEEWIKFISDKELSSKGNKELDKAQDKLKYLRCDREIRELYDAKRKTELNKNTDIIIAKEEGLKQGKEEGLKQGKEEGLKQGKEEMARNMLKEGLDINLILKISGLTIEEIKKLTDIKNKI
jgi:predicted transposase/invertase (TIGR01784 family)